MSARRQGPRMGHGPLFEPAKAASTDNSRTVVCRFTPVKRQGVGGASTVTGGHNQGRRVCALE